MMRKLFGTSNNLNQLVEKAHQLGVLDSQQYDKNVKQLNRMVLDIKKEVTLPKKME